MKKALIFDCERGSVDFYKEKNKIKLNGIFKDFKILNNSNPISGYKFYISRDHSTSYDLIKKINCKPALIIFDQHMDLWDYGIVGKKLNKANFIRKAFEEELLKFVVFVGVRKNEEAIYKKKLILNKFDRNFIKELRKRNALNGFEDKIKILKTKDFNKGLLKAFKFLKKKGFENICLDIDLDVFDSEIIKGVEYSKLNLKNVFNENIRKFIKHTLDQKGISVNFKKINKEFNFIYRHITEYKTELDDGRTLRLIKRLLNEI